MHLTKLLVGLFILTGCGDMAPMQPRFAGGSGSNDQTTPPEQDDWSSRDADAVASVDSGIVEESSGCRAMVGTQELSSFSYNVSQIMALFGIVIPVPVTVTPLLKLTQTPAEWQWTFGARVGATSRELPTLAASLAGYAGTITATLDQLGFATDCIVRATTVTTTIGRRTVTTAFDPPVPIGLGIGAGPVSQTFGPIVATVVDSTVRRAKVGDTSTGTVTIEAVAPEFDYASVAAQQNVTVRGDSAYLVTTAFGSRAATAMMGLRPATRYFVDEGKGTYGALVVESPAVVAGSSVFRP